MFLKFEPDLSVCAASIFWKQHLIFIRMQAERAEERTQFDEKMKQMEQRILAVLMPQGQVTAPTSSTPSLPIPPADRSS